MNAMLRRLPAQLGLPGWVGLVLLAVAVWGETMDAPRKQAELAELRADTAALRRLKPGELPREERPQAVLAAFYGRLPESAQRAQALSALLKRAQTQGLSVEAVQFRAQFDRASGLSRHEVNLPLKGSYPQLRDWIAASLQAQPGLSLDALQIRRDQAQADPVEARVKATLWVRNEPRRPRSPAAGASAAPRLAQKPVIDAQSVSPATLAALRAPVPSRAAPRSASAVLPSARVGSEPTSPPGRLAPVLRRSEP